jgi:hypothetical protein
MSKTRDNSRPVAAFIARKGAIDAILARLVRLSTEHFNLSRLRELDQRIGVRFALAMAS